MVAKGSDVVVIGAGMVGSAVACRLAQGGARVTVVDAGLPASGTSGRSFAWLNANNKPPREYHDLNVASMAEHRALEQEFGEAPWLRMVGNLQCVTDEAGRQEMRRKGERLESWGYRMTFLTPAEAQRELEPDLDLVGAGVIEVGYTPDEAWVFAPVLVGAFLREARRHGATVRPGARVVAVERAGSRVAGVTLATGERLGAEVVVDCAGAEAGRVAALAGVRLPLDNVPGLLAISAPVGTALRRTVHTPDVHFRPDGGGRVIMGCEDMDRAVDASTPLMPPPPASQTLLQRAARYLPALAGGRVESARVGIRPMPTDGLPIVGAAPGVEGFYVAVSHSGVTLGPLWGRVAAREILSGELDPRLAPFRPQRFEA